MYVYVRSRSSAATPTACKRNCRAIVSKVLLVVLACSEDFLMATLTSQLWSLAFFFVDVCVIYLEDRITVVALHLNLIILFLIYWVHLLALLKVFIWVLGGTNRIRACIVLLERRCKTRFTSIRVTTNAPFIDWESDAVAHHTLKPGQCLSDSRVKRHFDLCLIIIGDRDLRK